MDGTNKTTAYSSCKLLDLSDCAMLTLLSYLDATSLYNLSQTCNYFKNIIEDQTLWRLIDARTEPNTTEKVEFCIEKINDHTKSVLLRARSKKVGVVPYSFFKSTSQLDSITILALENQSFNAAKVTMNNFPSSLRELSLKKTYIKNARYFFRYSNNNMVNLRVLILDECKWVESSFLMSVTKYENLEIISTIKCSRLPANAVPYLCIARDGCKNLKIFDCRLTEMGHSLLTIFHKTQSLLGFYFQNYHTFNLDYNKTETYKPLPTQVPPHSYSSDEAISDTSLREYCRTVGANSIGVLPKSVLYKDPYDECKCKYKERTAGQANDDASVGNKCEDGSGEIGDNMDSASSDLCQSLICKKHRKKVIKEQSRNTVLNGIYKVEFSESENSDSEDDSHENNTSSSDDECCMYGTEEFNNLIVLRVITRPQIINNPPPMAPPPTPPRPTQRPPTPPSPSTAAPAEGPSQSPKPSNSANAPDLSHGLTRHERSAMKRKREGEETSGKRLKLKGSKALVTRLETSPGLPNDGNVNNNLAGPSNSDARNEPSSSGEPGPSSGIRQRDERRPSIVIKEVCVNPRNEFRCGAWLHRTIVNMRNYNNKWEPERVPLRRLSLRGFRKITDLSLNYIKDLNIDLLDLTYTSVTEKGIENFLAANPNCRIIHPKYCVCKPNVPI